MEENKIFRFDSEFFRKEFIANETRLELLNHLKLIRLTKTIRKGVFDISPNRYLGQGIPFLRVQNIKNGFLDKSDCIFISKEDSAIEYTTELDFGDIAMSKVGSVGNVCILFEKANVSQNAVAIKVNQNRINPFYLFAYLLTNNSKLSIQRVQALQVQSKLELEDIRDLKIPIFSDDFQTRIENIVKQANADLEESKGLYAEAQTLLLNELDVHSFVPATENTAVKSFRESFLQTGRLDAEYFHPEKGRMLDWLHKFRGKSIGYYVSPINELIDPTKGFSSELVANFDLTDALEIYLDNIEPIPAYELGSVKKVMKKGDVVISRLRSYLKEIAIVDTPEKLKVVGSSEFIILRLNDELINAETLLVYLRSLPVQLILKWCQSGSNHPRFMEEDLLAIKLPDKVLALQETLQINVRDAIAKNRDSKRLLGVAKRAVEIAIEEGERAAIEFIKLG